MMRVCWRVRASNALGAGTVLAVMALLVACSSASSRFGPPDVTHADAGPGYPVSAPDAASERIHTASVPRNADVYSESSGSSDDDYSGIHRDNDIESEPLHTAALQETVRPAGHSPARSGIVMVRPGDTLYGISRTHNVDVKQLIATNRIQPPYSIKVGQTLRLPGGAAARPAPAAQGGYHTVRPGDTLYSISRANGLKAWQVARANNIDRPYTIRLGQRLTIPRAGGDIGIIRTAGAPQTGPARASATRKPSPSSSPSPSAVPTPSRKPLRTVSTGQPAPKARPKPVYRGKLPNPSPRTATKFRWPVKGRIISRFGPKRNGIRNEGINIAVPAGTSVRAAENGVVAYSGNELRGYGNLVLIRHADNWVTAYAHNSKLLVRRGERVRRGQVVAKAGRSGSVKSPQLHFEIRRGSKAIDPLKALESTQLAGN